jgi:hypothetical protein
VVQVKQLFGRVFAGAMNDVKEAGEVAMVEAMDNCKRFSTVGKVAETVQTGTNHY